MADYSSIKGNRVQYLTSDPTLDSNSEGQVWYNSTTGSLKGLVHIKAWSSGGSMNTARAQGVSVGTQPAAIAFNGAPGSPVGTKSEEYTGFTWTATPETNTSRYDLGGAGTQTAALGFGGYQPGVPSGFSNHTEEWDGSSWTSSNNLPTALWGIRGCGLQTAALAFGGSAAGPGVPGVSTTSTYDGTSWTNVPATLNTARTQGGGVGDQTAALAYGGRPPSTPATATESYDGSSWTSVSSMNTGRMEMGYGGSQTIAIAFGGQTPPSFARTNLTEEWDGSSWTQSSATSAQTAFGAGCGTQSSALFCLLNNGSNITNTEEYNSNINTFTPATWASGGNMNTTRRNMAAAGITSSGLAIGGFGPPYIAAVEEYNGTSWSNGNNTPVAKENGRAGAGIQTAAFNAGGSGTDNGPAYSNSTQEYDGTNWTAGGNMNQQGLSRTSCGTLTAGLGFGGYIGGGFTNATEEYDGSTWTTSNTLPTASYYACAGTQTAALGVRSNSSPLTINYNGTSWTAGTGNLNVLTDIGSAAKNGTEIKTVFFGGNAGPAKTGATEEYDGTAFTNTASLTTARGSMGGSGDTDEAFAGGGFTGTNTNVTEEYTYQGTSATTASNLTTS